MRNSVLASSFALAIVITGSLAAEPALAAPDLVPFANEYRPGTVVISTHQRKLYYVMGDGYAVRYPVAVGKAGKQWSGAAMIDGKYTRPAWSPPDDVKRDNPSMPRVIPGGAPNNPMGVAALTLNRGQYAIHGTSASMRASIGSAASYGCIRMLNEHIIDLYARVGVGTPVVVVP